MNYSILLIDDNPEDNSGYINVLKKYYNVDVAISLVSAKRLIKIRQYDVIVIDVMMPTHHLNSHNELTAGFDFYSEILLPILNDLDTKPLVLFWSRLYRDSFYRYFGDHKPDNVFFIHKNQNNDHLLKEIELLLG